MLKIISLGAGVQSSTMALMAAHGEITPMPDYAIFADTRGEPQAVYDWLDWLEKQLPYPVIRVSRDDDGLAKKSTVVTITRDGERRYLKSSVPAFILNPDGSKGMARRQCTRDYKIDPIKKAVRSLGASTKNPCSTWIGISTDEAQRMKPSQDAAQVMRWPLIDMGVSRDDCILWFFNKGYPKPPKSACSFCPYHSDSHWLTMTGEEIKDALHYEESLQAAYKGASALTGVPYLHRSRIPLQEAIFNMRLTPIPQLTVDMFDESCEGMCGV